MILAALVLLAVQDPQDPLQTPAAWRPAHVTLTSHPRSLDLATPAGPAVIQLDSLLDFDRVDTAWVVAAVPDRTGKRVSVLVNVYAWSRGPESAMGYCGSGQEAALVWLTVPLVAPPQVMIHASCFLTREAGLTVNADSLWGEVDDYPKKVLYHLTFRIQQADSGLSVSQEPLPPP
jgi:hypothetical protein